MFAVCCVLGMVQVYGMLKVCSRISLAVGECIVRSEGVCVDVTASVYIPRCTLISQLCSCRQVCCLAFVPFSLMA